MELWQALAVLAGWALTLGVGVYLLVRWTIVVIAVLSWLLVDWVVWTSSFRVWYELTVGGIVT